jgi:hypothetical protein
MFARGGLRETRQRCTKKRRPAPKKLWRGRIFYGPTPIPLQTITAAIRITRRSTGYLPTAIPI